MGNFIDELNKASILLSVHNLNESLNKDVESIASTYSSICEIEAATWMSKSVCLGKLVQRAEQRGLTREKAIKDVASVMNETKQAVRKGAKTFDALISPRLPDGLFPLTDQRFYDIAIRYDKQTGKTPMEILEFIEDKVMENSGYTPMQAKVDLGLIDDNPSKKVIRSIIGLADADSDAIEEARPMLITEYSQKVLQAEKILANLLPSVPQESEEDLI